MLSTYAMLGTWAMVAFVALTAGAGTGVMRVGERWWARMAVCIGVAACGVVYLCSAYLPPRFVLATLLFLALSTQSLFAGFIGWPSARLASVLPYLYAMSLALYAALLLAIYLTFSSVPGLLGRGTHAVDTLMGSTNYGN